MSTKCSKSNKCNSTAGVCIIVLSLQFKELCGNGCCDYKYN